VKNIIDLNYHLYKKEPDSEFLVEAIGGASPVCLYPLYVQGVAKIYDPFTILKPLLRQMNDINALYPDNKKRISRHNRAAHYSQL